MAPHSIRASFQFICFNSIKEEEEEEAVLKSEQEAEAAGAVMKQWLPFYWHY